MTRRAVDADRRITLGMFVRSRRLARGLTQRQVLDRMSLEHGVEHDQTWLSNLERDRLKNLPDPTVIHALVDALQTDDDELMEALGYRRTAELRPARAEDEEAVFSSILLDVDDSRLPENVKDVIRRAIYYSRGLVEAQRTAERGT